MSYPAFRGRAARVCSGRSFRSYALFREIAGSRQKIVSTLRDSFPVSISSRHFPAGLSHLAPSGWNSLPALDPEIDLNPLVVLLQDAVILAQRMAFPTVGQQNAFQVGVAIELDAEHVEDFALQPVRSRPDGNGAVDGFSVGD